MYVAVSLSDVPVCASMSVLCVYVPGQIDILCVYACVEGQGSYKMVGFNLIVQEPGVREGLDL